MQSVGNVLMKPSPVQRTGRFDVLNKDLPGGFQGQIHHDHFAVVWALGGKLVAVRVQNNPPSWVCVARFIQTGAELNDSIRSAMTAARWAAVGGR